MREGESDRGTVPRTDCCHHGHDVTTCFGQTPQINNFFFQLKRRKYGGCYKSKRSRHPQSVHSTLKSCLDRLYTRFLKTPRVRARTKTRVTLNNNNNDKAALFIQRRGVGHRHKTSVPNIFPFAPLSVNLPALPRVPSLRCRPRSATVTANGSCQGGSSPPRTPAGL